MYENRICAFVDLLGFRSLVDASAGDASRTASILAALNSLQPHAIAEEMYARVEHDRVPPEQLEAVKEAARQMSASLAKDAEVRISYFSDCIFLSVDGDNIMASQLLLDRLSELSVTMWTQHGLLLRGGITKGQLIHVREGPVFGPALVEAYHMESKVAVYPRILVTTACMKLFRTAETFAILESMFESTDGYSYMSLATALRFQINDSTLVLGPPERLRQRMRVFSDAKAILEPKLDDTEDERVKEKYRWIIEDFQRRKDEIVRHPGL